MESARDSIKRFSRNSIKLLFEKRSTNPLRCCRTIWMNGCGNTMNHVHTAGSIAMGKRQRRHSWIPCHLQKRKCCSIVTTFQTKRKYDKSSDDVVTSTYEVGHSSFKESNFHQEGGTSLCIPYVSYRRCKISDTKHPIHFYIR